MPHLIHLHGPWECSPVEVSQADHIERRISFRRSFGRPTNLDPVERVILVCEIDEPIAAVFFNGKSLAENITGGEAMRHDVTTQLSPRNEMMIEVSRTADSMDDIAPRIHFGETGGLTGDVRLEIFGKDEAK